MRDFLINNIGVIGSVVGVLFFVAMLLTFSFVSDTKYEVIYKWYFIITIVIGSSVIGEEIAKWIVK